MSRDGAQVIRMPPEPLRAAPLGGTTMPVTSGDSPGTAARLTGP